MVCAELGASMLQYTMLIGQGHGMWHDILIISHKQLGLFLYQIIQELHKQFLFLCPTTCAAIFSAPESASFAVLLS
jgi:hypothetical protein